MSSIGHAVAFARSGRFWIAVAAVAALVLVRISGLGEFLSLDALSADRKALVTWVDAHRMLAATAYVLIYVAAVAFSLPGAVYLTLTGGFLFGAAFGTLLTLIGATAGAIIVFLFARILFGDRVLNGLATRYPTLVQAVQDHAWSYLLALRFVPLFPFFLINLIAAFVGVRLSTYAATTIIGILPGTAVFSLSGAGLGTILDQGRSVSIGSVMTPTVTAALIGLGVLSLAAIPIRKRFGKVKAEDNLLFSVRKSSG